MKHTVGVSFERTEAVSRARSRKRERERDPIFPPTWRFGRRRIPWTLGLASLLPGVDITIGVRSIRYRTDRDDWPTTAYTISNLELWNGGPAIFFPPSTTRDYRPPRDNSCSIPSFLSHCSALGTRAVRRPGNSSRNSNPERSEPRNPLLVRQYV